MNPVVEWIVYVERMEGERVRASCAREALVAAQRRFAGVVRVQSVASYRAARAPNGPDHVRVAGDHLTSVLTGDR